MLYHHSNGEDTWCVVIEKWKNLRGSKYLKIIGQPMNTFLLTNNLWRIIFITVESITNWVTLLNYLSVLSNLVCTSVLWSIPRYIDHTPDKNLF